MMQTPTPSRDSAVFAAELRHRIEAMAEGIVPYIPWYVDVQDVIQVGLEYALRAASSGNGARDWRGVQARARAGMRQYIQAERRHRICVVPLEQAYNESTDGVAAEAMSRVARDALLEQLDDTAAEICTLKLEGHQANEVAEKQGTHRNTVRNRLLRARENVQLDDV